MDLTGASVRHSTSGVALPEIMMSEDGEGEHIRRRSFFHRIFFSYILWY